MAVKLISNYAKRLGLPGYSSHQFSVSVETELNDIDQINAELSKIYHDLQAAVDREIQVTGFVPDDSYGQVGKINGNGANWHQTEGAGRHPSSPANSNRSSNAHNASPTWKCSEKQKSLIFRLIKEHDLDEEEVESIAHQRFGVGLVQLNKLQASGLISELIETYGHSNRNGYRQGQSSAPSRKGGQR